MQEPSFKQIDVKTRRRTRSKEKHKIESELFPTEYPIPSTAIIPTQSELELKK